RPAGRPGSARSRSGGRRLRRSARPRSRWPPTPAGPPRDRPPDPARPPSRGPSRRRRSHAALVLVDDYAADVLPRQEVLVALVDLLQGVAAGDEGVELEVAAAVEPEQPRDVGGRVAVAEQAALHRLLPQ